MKPKKNTNKNGSPPAVASRHGALPTHGDSGGDWLVDFLSQRKTGKDGFCLFFCFFLCFFFFFEFFFSIALILGSNLCLYHLVLFALET